MAHSLLLLAGLVVLLRALQPERTFARVATIALLEFYTLRYYMWRVVNTLPAFELTWSHTWQWLFFGMETLATLFVCWSAFVLIRRSDHSALADARERALRARPVVPKVTILIPTVNEAREVLEPTIRAAAAIDYPNKEVVILDDDKGPKRPRAAQGLRRLLAAPRRGLMLVWRGCQVPLGPIPTERVHAFLPALCEKLGAKYLRRPTSDGAKAGNLNYGLSRTDGDVVLVLDADFRATRNILWRTVGLLDEDVALVQTPQHYYSSDPTQHNLGGEKTWVEEQRHFFDIVLPSRCAWGNALCIGTGFVVRRAALGPKGFETGCLSEDVYGGYALISRGYQIKYLNERLSFGAAADSLSEYIRQRVRWCQGIIQAIWLPSGPFRARGLRLVDRVFYLEMPLYWVSQFGFLACLICAPLIYFWTGVPVFDSPLDEAVSHVLPRVVATSMVGYWISKGRVMPIITDIQKLVCVFYIVTAILSLVVNPRGKPFTPTLKCQQRDRIAIHGRVLWPFLALGVLIAWGMWRTLTTDGGPVGWDEYLPMNIALGLYVVSMLFLCCLTCIDWPKNTQISDYHQTLEGRWIAAMRTLLRIPGTESAGINGSRSWRSSRASAQHGSASWLMLATIVVALGLGGAFVGFSGSWRSARDPLGAAEPASAQPRAVPAAAAMHCVAFSAYVDGYSPSTGPHPKADVIDALLDDIVANTDFRCIMTYGLLNGQDDIVRAAWVRGLKVIAILWLDGNQQVDDASVALGIQTAKAYRDTIVLIACGSEVRVRHGAATAEAVIGRCVSSLRAAGVTQPIGANDTWWALCNESWPCREWGFVRRLDWIGANVYAWFENQYSGVFPCIPADRAAAFHVARLQQLTAMYASQEVILSEFGWPAGPDGYTDANRYTQQRCGVASETGQREVVNATVAELRRLNLPHVVFSAFREPWKTIEGPFGPWWGLRDAAAIPRRR